MKPIPHNSLAEEGTAARVRAPPKAAARKVFFMKAAQVGGWFIQGHRVTFVLKEGELGT
jgi:hypothetical protein